jgi:DNA-binding response OmpR family regulator
MTPCMKRLTLLLIEDDPTVAAGLIWGLTHEGHEVHHSHSGRPAIGLVQHHAPDAVILDITLEDIDGIAVGRFVRERWPEIPIVFVTGHDEYEGLMESLEHPRSACLQKPFSITNLEETILRLLEG